MTKLDELKKTSADLQSKDPPHVHPVSAANLLTPRKRGQHPKDVEQPAWAECWWEAHPICFQGQRWSFQAEDSNDQARCSCWRKGKGWDCDVWRGEEVSRKRMRCRREVLSDQYGR